MTNEQILKKAIEKAVDNGFILKNRFGEKVMVFFDDGESYADFIKDNFTWSAEFFHIIFSHDFAKAFWGEEIINWMRVPFRAMDYHLREMVITEEPIKYLEKFL